MGLPCPEGLGRQAQGRSDRCRTLSAEIAVFVVLLLIIFGPEKLLERAPLGNPSGAASEGLKGNEDEAKSTVSEIREAMNPGLFSTDSKDITTPGPRLQTTSSPKRVMIL